MSNLPKVFIASSSEAILVAEAVNIKLEHEATVKQWDNAFDLSSMTITSLIKRAEETDYSIFVFHKDDKTIIRDKTYSVVRDNVLFELGLFIGVLGIEKCFILIPKSTEENFRLPTDLAGVTITKYDDEQEDMVDAVATSCAKIKNAIRKQKNQEIIPLPENKQLENQLNSTQSELWMMKHELERANEEKSYILSAIYSHFFSIAKPATEIEIKLWEDGAKKSYTNDIKIHNHNVYFIDKDIILPPSYGAKSISIIVAEGVKVFGVNEAGHNSVYYMDGFRKLGL